MSDMQPTTPLEQIIAKGAQLVTGANPEAAANAAQNYTGPSTLPANFSLSQVDPTSGAIHAPQNIQNTAALGSALNTALLGIPGRIGQGRLMNALAGQYAGDPRIAASQAAGAPIGTAASTVGLAKVPLPFLGKLGTTGNVLGGAARGAIEGGVFGGLNQIGANNPNAGRDIALSALLGGGLGAGANLAGGMLSRAATGEGIGSGKLAQALKKGNTQAILGMSDIRTPDILKQAQFGINRSMTGLKGMRAQDLEEKFANVVAQNKLVTPEAKQAWITQEFTKPYEAMRQAWNQNGQPVTQYMDVINQLPEVQSLTVPQKQAFMQTLATAADEPDFVNVRKILGDDILEGAMAQGKDANFKQKVADAASATKGAMDEIAAQQAIANGSMNTIDLDKLRELYPVAKLMKASIARDNAQVVGAHPGSDTAIRMVTGAFLGDPFGPIGELAGGLAGAATGNILNQAVTKGLNRIGLRTAVGLRPLIQGLGGASNISPAVGAAVSGAAPLLGRAAGFAGPAMNAIGIPPIQTQQAPQTSSETGFDNALQKGIDYRIQQTIRSNPLYNTPQAVNDMRRGIMDVIQRPDGSIDKVNAAKFLFQNPTDVETYAQYAQAMSHIDSLLNSANVGITGGMLPGIRGKIDPSGIYSREGIISAIKGITGSDAAAKEANAALTYEGQNKQRIQQTLRNIVIRYSPNPTKLQELLKQTGET